MSLLTNLISATYTPFHSDGTLKLEIIKDYVDYLLEVGMSGLYVCGSTGEGINLTTQERKQTAEAFLTAAEGRVPVVIQVGTNSLSDCKELARHAESLGAAAVSANAPSYFKITSTELLVDYMAEIAAASPKTPFYYYHIPFLTGVSIDLVRFLELAETRIPQLVGIKYTDTKVFEYQDALCYNNGKYELLWGCDEMMLSALAVGMRAGVGSTFALIPNVYRTILDSWKRNDLALARSEQLRSYEYVKILNRYGNLHAAQKLLFKKIGLDLGSCRLPIPPFTQEASAKLHRDIEAFLPAIGR